MQRSRTGTVALNRGLSEKTVFSFPDDESDSRCLADLCITDPRLDKQRIEGTKGGLLRDSYGWIFDYPDFQGWRNDTESRLFWINGYPGTGKTMLLCGIIDEISSSTKLTDQFASTVVSYFFCQAADSRINNATSVLRGLIYLLVYQQPALLSHVRKEYDRAGNQLFEGENAWIILSTILTNILHDLVPDTAYLIIDALDECVSGLSQLLDLITKISSLSSRVKWLVSSRNTPDIEQRLSFHKSKVILNLGLNQMQMSRAIDAYIDNKVSRLESLQDDHELRDQVRHALRRNAGGSFLWASLVIRELQMAISGDISKLLDELPSSLMNLYDRAMNQIQMLEEEMPQFCLGILSTTTLAYRPLKLAELSILSGLPNYISESLEVVREIVNTCSPFLIVRDDSVYFTHISAKDYLSYRSHNVLFPSSLGMSHHGIFSRSLTIMAETLQQDMYRLQHPGYPIDKVYDPLPCPLAAAQYSCIYWVDHFCDSGSGTSARQDNGYGAVHAFLREKYLYWIEALSLLQSMNKGVISMQRLESVLSYVENQPLIDLVRDARRFILSHRQILEIAPLQVYTSALIFSPTRSLVREHFKEKEAKWITTKPLMNTDWNACLMTLEGHGSWVRSVTFSADGEQLASASDDETVRIWSATTGQCLQTLEGHRGWVRSVAFSANDRQLASGSGDKTVRVWDAATGECLQTLKGHNGWIRSVAFSADGHRLASASDDETVKIWNTATGECIQTIKGHDDWVNAVAFSANGQQLATASDDKTVKIWDMATGQCFQTLEGHSGWVRSVAFSTNGLQFASASSDETVRIWDISTGQCLWTLEGHSDWVKSVAFSADGQRLASASDDETVRIWDTSTGKCVQTLGGHSDWVNTVAFSANNQRLASASGDNTIKIWDAAMNPVFQMLEGHSRSVNAIAFSADGRQLASASDDKSVKIWDTATGHCLYTFEGHNDLVNTVAFSADGQRLASASDDKTVRIWNTVTIECLQTVQLESSLTSLSFGLDGSYLLTEVGRIELEESPHLEVLATGINAITATTTSPTVREDSTPEQHDLDQRGYDLSPDRSWITWNGENILWLPLEYRAQCSATSGRMICIGCRSGRVLFFSFSFDSYF